ncbi:meteorin isoform X2 [Cavia porcellus]|uniref:meteorin isoform X2 n=1 Tax=Cavia porcellus TaxID=10141 RepID=UPI000350F759|nr:meteorin isoform X2 [Cavia porcellus]
MPPPVLFCALCCGLLAASARASYSTDPCSWRGSGLTQEPGSVGQLALACAEGSVEWLYPVGALRLALGGPDPSTRPGVACLRPLRPFTGAQVFAERAGGTLELLLAEGPGLAGGRCVHWGPRERRALFLQATPQRDISRRAAAFRFELREDGRPELLPQGPGLGMNGQGSKRPEPPYPGTALAAPLLFGPQELALAAQQFPNIGACEMGCKCAGCWNSKWANAVAPRPVSVFKTWRLLCLPYISSTGAFSVVRTPAAKSLCTHPHYPSPTVSGERGP